MILNYKTYLLLFTMLSGVASAQKMLEPPFGLCWGDSPEKLIQWATKSSLDVNIFLPGNKVSFRILKISSQQGNLPEIEAREIEAKFFKGKLVEVTVHYFDTKVSAEQMEERFKLLKKQVTSEQGELQIDQQNKNVVDSFSLETISYRRENAKGLNLLLASTRVEDLLRKTQKLKFSLVYQNGNLLLDLERN